MNIDIFKTINCLELNITVTRVSITPADAMMYTGMMSSADVTSKEGYIYIYISHTQSEGYHGN